MQCPECDSNHIRKNGIKKGKQNHLCVDCGRQFIDKYEEHRGYSDEVKRMCLKMYVNGMGFRAIERVTKVHHTTIITNLVTCLYLRVTYTKSATPDINIRFESCANNLTVVF